MYKSGAELKRDPVERAIIASFLGYHIPFLKNTMRIYKLLCLFINQIFFCQRTTNTDPNTDLGPTKELIADYKYFFF